MRTMLTGLAGVILLAVVHTPGLACDRLRRGGLEYDLVLLPSDPLPSAPVAVQITVRNPGPNAIEIQVPFLLHTGLLEIDIDTPDGEERRLRSSGTWLGVTTRRVQLLAGDSYTNKEWVFYHLREFILSTPGSYQVRARVRPSPEHGWIELAPANLEVSNPTVREEEARDLFAHEDIGLGFSPGKATYIISKEAKRRLGLLRSDYGRTQYGMYARYMLASALAYGAFASERELVRRGKDEASVEGDRDSVLRELHKLRSEGPPDNIRDEIELDLARYSLRVGRKDDARECLAYFNGRDLPDRLARTYRELSKKLAIEPRETPGDE